MNKMASCVAACAAAASAFAQVTAGQTDTFTTDVQAWTGANPTWVSTGGPAGAGDGFLQIHSVGGSGQGSHLAVNNSTQWRGNYTGAGISAVTVDFKNLGATAVNMRMVFFNTDTSTQWVSNFSADLAAGSSWQHFTFTIDSSLFTQTEGAATFADTLLFANRLMFRHDPGPPSNGGIASVSTLGIDNVHAVPEPASLCVLGLGLLAARRRRK